jgi:tRNA(Ile)-lysidine synthase
MFEKIYTKFLINLDFLQLFEANPKIAIALSGGSDSMALLLLAKRWINQVNGELTAITVNHNLRDSSGDEAIAVGQICQKLNIKHVILDWHHNVVINSNIQAKAREARYNLLTTYCKEHDILHLFTGHHQDDQVENFFIKLSRASGIFGLVENNYNFINNVRVCKPILNLTKDECLLVLENKQVSYVIDPSNSQKKYFRNAIRFNIQDFLHLGSISSELFQKRIIGSLNNLRRSAKIIQDVIISAMSESVSIHEVGYAKINLQLFKFYPQDIKQYLLEYLLMIISGDDAQPRSIQTNKLLRQIDSSDFKFTTLKKCIIAASGNSLIIYRELCTISDSIALSNLCLWDNRFRFYALVNDPQLEVGCLDLASYQAIKEKINFDNIGHLLKLKHKILFTIPVIKRLEKVVAIPNINYYEEFSKKEIVSIFEPQYISKIIHLPINSNLSL